MATIPRLISVAEIIKREYLKKLDPSNSEGGALPGLHQYNEIGCLEEPDPPSDDPEAQDQVRQSAITRALQGKNQYVRDLSDHSMRAPGLTCSQSETKESRLHEDYPFTK